MYLQENKRTNLKIAIKHINSIEIKPNEVFSIWRLVGRPSKKRLFKRFGIKKWKNRKRYWWWFVPIR